VPNQTLVDLREKKSAIDPATHAFWFELIMMLEAWDGLFVHKRPRWSDTRSTSAPLTFTPQSSTRTCWRLMNPQAVVVHDRVAPTNKW